MKLAQADERKLLLLLEELARTVEDLLLTGLTTASDATRQALMVAFQEASRLRLLRLGSTLRTAADELGRFTRNEAGFSRQRLLFFLNRAWMLSHGLTRALRNRDEKEFDRLLYTPSSQPAAKLEVVTLGVGKKITAAFVAFDFRLRVLKQAGSIPAGQRLAWSCIFPIKPGADIPAEGFLHLPQKQKFNASVFLEKSAITVEKAAVTLDDWGGGRLALEDGSKVTAGKEFTDWEPLLAWDPARALERVEKHDPGPFDLDIEMQEEIVLRDWELGAPDKTTPESQKVYPLTQGETKFHAVISAGAEGAALTANLADLAKKKKRPPLFGLLHYEKCRLTVQPLTSFGKEGPEYLTISKEKVDRAALLKALKF